MLGVRTSAASSGGALVADVTASSAADTAGLRAGDVITAVGGRRVEDPTDLAAAIRSSDPGDRVTITYVREGKTRTTTATLGSATG